MKKLLLLILTTFSCVVIAQTPKWPDSLNITLPSKKGNIFYEHIINIDSASKDQLFNAARSWFSSTFLSAKSVLDLDDRSAGKLIGKGNLSYTGLQKTFGERRASFIIDITVKDGKYRVIVYDIKDLSENGYGDLNLYNFENLHPELRQKYKAKFKYDALSSFDQSIKLLLASLDKALKDATKDAF